MEQMTNDTPYWKERLSAHDTISRQAAIRWVKTECNPYGNPTLDFESGKKVIEHLEQMPSTQPEQRWTPCSEGLPKKVGDYFVTTQSGQIARYIYMGTDSSKEYWMRCVAAWMPLPKAWKGEKDE